MTKKTSIMLVAALVLVALGVGAMYVYNQQAQNYTTQTYDPKTQGKVVFGITDAAATINGVSSIFITVNSLQIHSAASGWVSVFNEAKQYDLLALKQSGAVSLLANANINAGTYDQMKLMVSKVVVVKNGVAQEAKLPSGELKIIGDTVINTDTTSSVVFDFLADKSLHVTGSGKFIFAPVVKIQKQSNATVQLNSNNQVTITGGNQHNDQNVGMDEKGEVKSNFELTGNLTIDNNNRIQLEGGVQAGQELVFDFTAQNNSGVSGTATLSEENGKTMVTLKLKSGIAGLIAPAQPAHIHLGSCANIGGVKYPLNSVVNGKSETMLALSLAQLKAELPLALNVHKSAAESNVYIACTDMSV